MAEINLGVHNLPKVAKDISDRNRTSPIAFTGNKFEFRAVGSTANVGEPACIVNLMLTEGFSEIRKRIEKKGKGDVKHHAFDVLKEVLKETRRIRFEGNSYSEEWHKEAEKRGLPNDKNTPTALERFLEKDAVSLMTRYGILTEKEVHSKIEIKLEEYVKIKLIEMKTMTNVARTMVLPALAQHLGAVAGTASAVNAAGISSETLVRDVTVCEGLYASITAAIDGLNTAIEKTEKLESDLKKQAAYVGKQGVTAMDALRSSVDAAEALVAYDLWPMARYQELLDQL